MEHQRNCPNYLIFPSTVGNLRPEGFQKAKGEIELSIAPDKNIRLVPPHARKDLVSRGLDLEGFVPLSKDEMMARLD